MKTCKARAVAQIKTQSRLIAAAPLHGVIQWATNDACRERVAKLQR
jgi:hypothetical protein